MADTPAVVLSFSDGRTCPDCGVRTVVLPEQIPAIGDDFDWLVRDYDGFRLFMLEQLLARFPERTRWTPADMEVVLVETLSVLLDQLSDMLDRVHAEAFLETARRPESVRRLLAMIGYDAIAHAGIEYVAQDIDQRRVATAQLDREWSRNPRLMELARAAGPAAIHDNHRMVSTSDYAERIADHPLGLRAHAWSRWTGSWTTISIAVICYDNVALDDQLEVPAIGDDDSPKLLVRREVDAFHIERGLRAPYATHTLDESSVSVEQLPNPRLRTVLRMFVDAYRMVGQEVLLEDAEPVGVVIAISVRITGDYFRSEIINAVAQALGTGPEGFFHPGRLAFGEDLHASDIFATVMTIDGVQAACLNRFKRVGAAYADQADSGRIALSGIEVAVCDNDPLRPQRGQLRITVHGGRKG